MARMRTVRPIVSRFPEPRSTWKHVLPTSSTVTVGEYLMTIEMWFETPYPYLMFCWILVVGFWLWVQEKRDDEGR